MLKTKKSKIITVICIVLVAVAAIIVCAYLFLGNKNIEKLNNGITSVNTYVDNFNSEEKKTRKESVYRHFLDDEELSELLALKPGWNSKNAYKKFSKTYQEANATMYEWILSYYENQIDELEVPDTEGIFNELLSAFDNYTHSNAMAVLGNCKESSTIIAIFDYNESLDKIQKKITRDSLLSDEDKTTLGNTISDKTINIDDIYAKRIEVYQEVFDTIKSIHESDSEKSQYEDAYDELRELSDKFDGQGNPDSEPLWNDMEAQCESYLDKINSVEESEAEEAQASWKITASIDGVIYNAPQIIYEASNKGKVYGEDYGWYPANYDSSVCCWQLGDTVYHCDTEGNIVYTLTTSEHYDKEYETRSEKANAQ